MHHETDSAYRNVSPKADKDKQPIPVFIVNNKIENNHDFAINVQHFEKIHAAPNNINPISLKEERPKLEKMQTIKKQLEK